MENLMSKTSKHWIRIYPDDKENNVGLIVIPASLNSLQAQATLQAVQTGHQIASTYHTSSSLKSMYYQKHSNNKIITKQVALLEFNHYEKKEYMLDHKGELTFTNFEDFLFSNIPVTVNEKDKSWFENYFAQFPIHDDLIIQLEFKTHEGKMTIARKEFQKKIDNRLVPYFGETIPSVFKSMNSKLLYNFEHVIFEENKKTYLKLYHYTQLGLQVYTTINPDENKVVPAVIVEDMKGNPLEVHCYYKGTYISKDILHELKPDILQEDFKNADYFNARDIEFLDMVMI